MGLLEDYITGRKVIKDEQERAAVMILTNGVCYDFGDEQVRELYDRYNNKELTDVQMTYHIALLYSLLANDAQNGIIPSYTMWQKPILIMVIAILIFGVIPILIDKVRVNEQK